MQYQAADPHYAQKVRESFAHQQFMEFIGAQIDELGPGSCTLSLPYKPELQQHGFFHAGIIGTLADNAGGYAAYSLMPPDCSVLTVEYKLNLLAPGLGEQLISRARFVKPGRTLTVCNSEVFAVRDGVKKLCATTLMCVADKPDRPDNRWETAQISKRPPSSPSASRDTASARRNATARFGRRQGLDHSPQLPIRSTPARSAIVRANLRMRVKLRAERPSLSVTCSSS